MNAPPFAPEEAPAEYEAIGNLIHQAHSAHDEALATPRWRPIRRRRLLRQAEHLDRQATSRAHAYLDSLPRATQEPT